MKRREAKTLEQGVQSDPLVQAVLERFPGAEIVGVNRRDEAPEAAMDAMPPDGRRAAAEPGRLRRVG